MAKSTKIPFRTILDKMADGVLIQDAQGQVVYANNAVAKLLETRSLSMLNSSGQRILDNHEVFDEAGSPLSWPELPMNRSARTKRPLEAALRLVNRKTGLERWFAAKISLVLDQQKNVNMVVGVFHEITVQKRQEEKIGYFATHDTLTGLSNRKHFNDRLDELLVLKRSILDKLAILFIDMDRLKNINDSVGHAVGDAVLKEAAVRMRKILRPKDLIARWGGDEFVVILEDIQSGAEAQRMARRLISSMSPPVHTDSHLLHITASIGIALWPDDGLDGHTVLKNADIALYRAKKSGKNRSELYHRKMNLRTPEKLALENDLRMALKNKEFELYFQPILDLGTSTVNSAETLLRWNHPMLGPLKPGRFINMAEDMGIISSLGKWVMENACEQVCRWQNEGLDLRVAVNISAKQFADNNFAGEVFASMRRQACDPHLFEIEVTESVAMDNLNQTTKTLKQLNDYGVRVIVDDFGTGYSSLSYLKRFPISKLKIDKSFIHQMMTDEQDVSIIKAIISMAHSLRLKVVAEGVDTQQQLVSLASLGCDEAQGNFISPPLKAKDLSVWLEAKQIDRN